MGYHVWCKFANITIKTENQLEAFYAIKKFVSGQNHWGYKEEVLRRESLAEFLRDLGWVPEEDQDGNIVSLEFTKEKYSDEYNLFKSIAPYIEDGGIIEMWGDDDFIWQWQFYGGEIEEVPGIVTFKSSRDKETINVEEKL